MLPIFRVMLVLAIFLCPVSVGYARTIEFAGQTWTVKTGGPKGPGPNQWSDSTDSVWVDELGRLHLKIRKINGVWHCAEVTAQVTATHGNYRFMIDSDTHAFDRNTVVGLFTYNNDTEEIDVEMSRWSNPEDQEVGQFVVQPAGRAGNLEGFSLATAGAQTTHEFNWQPDSIFFQSYVGHADSPVEDNLIHQYRYTGADIPPLAPGAKVHLNFWLVQGRAPSDGQETELIISDFSYSVPLTGDLNADGFIGIDDLNMVLGNWNKTAAQLADLRADATGDGFVGIDDLNAVLGNWNQGEVPPVQIPQAVPEPGAFGLFGTISACVLSRVRLGF